VIQSESFDVFFCAALASAANATPARGLEDAEVIEEFLRSGDDDLFAVLIQRYQDRVMRLVASILGPNADADAEDLVQEVFLNVYRKLATFRGDCRFSTWLYRLARNRAIDARRRRKPHIVQSVEQPQGATEPRVGSDLEAEIGMTRQESAVLQAVNALGEPRRSVVFLHYWMGYGIDEISGLTEIPAGTVKSHLHRARRLLATVLREEAADG
jgi:RNA polymerase sigma-70 factor (ECF subfamily)